MLLKDIIHILLYYTVLYIKVRCDCFVWWTDIRNLGTTLPKVLRHFIISSSPLLPTKIFRHNVFDKLYSCTLCYVQKRIWEIIHGWLNHTAEAMRREELDRWEKIFNGPEVSWSKWFLVFTYKYQTSAIVKIVSQKPYAAKIIERELGSELRHSESKVKSKADLRTTICA